MLKVVQVQVVVIFTWCVSQCLSQEIGCQAPGVDNGRCISIYACSTALLLLTRIQNGEEDLIVGLKSLRCSSPHHADVRVCCSYEGALNQTGLDVLNADLCGDSDNDRIVNGVETMPGEYPWMALLGYTKGNSTAFRCAGSLISKRYVLTAAHCIHGEENKLKFVRLGEHDTTTEDDCFMRGNRRKCIRALDYGIEQIIKHPQFRHDKLSYDVGLLRLSENVRYQKHIIPICLPVTETSTRLDDEQSFFVAGWGGTETAHSSSVLLKALVDMADVDTCRKVFRGVIIDDNQICAGNLNQQDSCKGDSGGPLFYVKRFQPYVIRYIQYGIVSAGSQTCSRDRPYPALYTNVMHHLPWITSNIY